MTRLHRAFDALIAHHAERGADDLWAAATKAAAPAPETRAATRPALAAAVLVAVALAAGVVAVVRSGDADAPGVTAGPASSTPTAEPGTTAVEVFFSPADDPTCTAVVPRPRRASADDPIAGALAELLAGPTEDDTDIPVFSWFSPATADTLRSVQVVDGVALVDFEPFASIIPNASTSCGSSSLLAQLDATVTQFPGIERAVYSFDGSPDAFYGWLQLNVPAAAPSSEEPIVDLPIVAASESGVDIVVGGASLRQGAGAATVAYATRERAGRADDERWIVAFQRGETPVVVRRAGATTTYEPTDGAHTITLLDVERLADGRAVVLVAERLGSGVPDALRERLVLIDATSGERTTVVDRPAWESAHLAAAVLPDGAVVGLLATEARVDRVRWEAGRDDPVWTASVAVDDVPGLAVDGGAGRTTLVRSEPAAGTIWIDEVLFDVTTGLTLGERSLRPELGAPLDPSARCTDVLADGRLLCWATDALPVLVSPRPDGPATVTPIGSLPSGAHVSLVR